MDGIYPMKISWNNRILLKLLAVALSGPRSRDRAADG